MSDTLFSAPQYPTANPSEMDGYRAMMAQARQSAPPEATPTPPAATEPVAAAPVDPQTTPPVEPTVSTQPAAAPSTQPTVADTTPTAAATEPVADAEPEPPADPLANFQDAAAASTTPAPAAPTDAAAPVAPAVPSDWARIAEQVGEPIKDVSDLATKYKAQRDQFAELSANPMVKSAMEAARLGVDPALHYQLSTMDLSGVPDRDLVANDLVQTKVFETLEAAQSALEHKDDLDLRLLAGGIRQKLEGERQAQLAKMEEQAARTRQEAAGRFQESVRSLDTVAGIPVSQEFKRQAEQDFQSGTLNKWMFGSDGKPDFATMMKAKWALENMERVVQTVRTQAAQGAKSEAARRMSNAAPLKANGHVPSPQTGPNKEQNLQRWANVSERR